MATENSTCVHDFPIKTSIHKVFPVATFDYQRACPAWVWYDAMCCCGFSCLSCRLRGEIWRMEQWRWQIHRYRPAIGQQWAYGSRSTDEWLMNRSKFFPYRWWTFSCPAVCFKHQSFKGGETGPQYAGKVLWCFSARTHQQALRHQPKEVRRRVDSILLCPCWEDDLPLNLTWGDLPGPPENQQQLVVSPNKHLLWTGIQEILH